MSDGIKKGHIRDLVPDDHNARAHNPRNIQMIVDSLQEVGAARSIVIDENGKIIAGNGVIEGAAQAGLTDIIIVPSDGRKIIAVQRTDLTEEQKVRMALFDNRTAELSEWETNVLSDYNDTGLLEGMWSQDELKDLFRSAYEEKAQQGAGAGGDEFDETPKQGPTRTNRGDLWRIGPHRLLCGDARVPSNYEKLLERHPDINPIDQVDLLFTDPPYGVSYDRARGDYQKEIQNDELRGDDLYNFLLASFQSADPCLRSGCPLYVFHGDGPYGTRLVFERAFIALGWHLSATLIWVKNMAGYGYADYRAKHEPILYGWKEGDHYFTPDRTQTTEWRFDRDPASEYLHPTQKPIELIEKALRNSSTPGNIVLDPFAGGGPTLIAAHRTGRTARLMDIDPVFCDVILNRAEAEGITPIQRLFPPPV